MSNYRKITKDLYTVQMSWTLGFLGVVFIVNIIKIGLNAFNGTEVDGGFYGSILIASNIYMLIIGMIAINFLPYYVENGVTRKDTYIGTLLSAIGLSISIPIITFLVSLVERFVVTNFLNLSYKVQDINEVVLDLDGNIIGDLVISVILTPYIDPQNNWLLGIVIFSMNIFIFYLLGWFISTGFYVGGLITGIGFILAAIIINLVKDTFLRVSLDLPLAVRLDTFASLPHGVTWLGIFLLMIIIAWIIRRLTRKVAIKM